MIITQKVIDALKYGHTYTPQSGISLNDDLIQLLEEGEFVGADAAIEELRDDKQEIFAMLPHEDHLSDVINELHLAKTLKKADMIEEIKRIANVLEEMNLAFCNAQSYAATMMKPKTEIK